jgi:hypothetical protein
MHVGQGVTKGGKAQGINNFRGEPIAHGGGVESFCDQSAQATLCKTLCQRIDGGEGLFLDGCGGGVYAAVLGMRDFEP